VPTVVATQAAADESLLSSGLLHELFEEQAGANPNATAVKCGTVRLTYGELEAKANQVARYLRVCGVRPEDRVGLLLPRSPELYTALLGILKAGAAYVPLDPEYPADRIGFILADCQARALLTCNDLAGKASAFAGEIIRLDAKAKALASLPSEKPTLEKSVGPESLCYIIYTSGTTGRPKGVQLEHRSVCHLVRAEARIFQVLPTDRVYQGFSVAFDASVEEIWLAFFAGATLVAAPPEKGLAGPGLAAWLNQADVTVLSCVPTLLSMLEEDVPSVRLLILGGEACPPHLVNRWWKAGRRIVNTYGPTEATVIATYAELRPGQPVTIGKPLPNYSAMILDDQLHLVSDGTAGELCLGGIGLARGYVGLPELTGEKFIAWSATGSIPMRLYRTGDLARRSPTGDLEFLGRLDNQVKVRGYRVELSEIEAVLMECPGVRAAAVALHEGNGRTTELVAYVVPKIEAAVDLAQARGHLRVRLPSYMVPGTLELLSALPTLPSGKVDRKALPPPKTERREENHSFVSPHSALESHVAGVWQKVLGTETISIEDDLFLDLGGHSLLAARIVSELRKTAPLDGLSMADIYAHPTIKSLAAAFEGRQRPGQPVKETLPRNPVPFWRHFWCGTAQAISLIFILSFFALQWLAPYLTYTILIEEEYDFLASVLGALGSLIVLYPIMVTIPIVLKWLVIGRYRPGSYPLWGFYYFRWWLVTTVEAAVPVSYLVGTPLLNIYLRLMGAKVGCEVHIHSNNFAIYDLLSIGDHSSVNVDANLLGYTVEDGLLKLGTVSIGSRCFVGVRATVSLNGAMGNKSALEDLSLLSGGSTIPPGETWRGSPAQRAPDVETRFGENSLSSSGGEGRGGEASGLGSDRVHDFGSHRAPSPRKLGEGTSSEAWYQEAPLNGSRRFFFGIFQGIGLLIFPVLVVAALFPGIVVMNKLNYLDPYYWYLLLSPLVGVSFVAVLCLEIAALKWLLLGKVRAGRYPTLSFYYLRKWFVDQTMDLSLDVLGPLYASVYLTPWYKLLGAKLGSGAEISTASFISPDLLSIGEESFIADNVSLGAARIRDGFLTVGSNQIGKRTFIGNSALLAPGTVIGDNVLIGCLSTAPTDPTDALRSEATWLGSPPICLSQRQQSAAFGEERTFHPSVKLRVQRAMIEFVRVIMPSTCFIILLSLLFSSLLLLNDSFSLLETMLFFPPLYLGCGLAATLFTIALKWLIVWRYRPQEKPLWSTFVWRNELLNALHEHLAGPFLVGPLTGTPFICWYFRALGARIGRRVYMETADLSEFDLVRVDDEAVLNADCTIQTHLFEDRVMKMSRIEIGQRCRVGAGSLVLYDTQMEDGAWLGDLSLLMKNEVLPANTRWEGIPARPSSPPTWEGVRAQLQSSPRPSQR
jgi:non-ribosomal peptide synthetase-like protein